MGVMISVSIYEDNHALRETLETIINTTEGLSLCGSHSNCMTIRENIEIDKPDVILMDIDMPGKSGIEGLIEVKTTHPEIEVIMNTVYEDDDNVYNALCFGATGYILKKSPLALLISSIKDVMTGGAPMSPSIARKVLGHFNKKDTYSSMKTLSPRELEILQFLANGYSYKMVGDLIGISLDTVRSHVKKIYKKLHVNSITGAIHKTYLKR